MQQMNYPEGLYNSITGLTNQLVDNNVDYRLSAVSQASGCVAGPTLYIDNTFSSADIQSTFEGMINVQNTYSANSEQNLQTLKYALEAAQQGQCNEGLVRENTKLNLIGVSEEDDESPLPYTEYLNAYNNHVYGQNDLRVHAIGSDPTLCQVPNYYAGLYDASIATGGFFFSICTDPINWTYELETLADNISAHAENSLYLDTIELSHPAVEASIEVFVDGTPQPQDGPSMTQRTASSLTARPSLKSIKSFEWNTLFLLSVKNKDHKGQLYSRVSNSSTGSRGSSMVKVVP